MIFLLKVRENVVIEDDLNLALLELRRFFDDVQAHTSLGEALSQLGLLEIGQRIPVLLEPHRGNGVGAFTALKPRLSLDELMRRLSYIQEMIIIGKCEETAKQLMTFHQEYPWNSRFYALEHNCVILRVIPLFCILEHADLVVRTAKRISDVPKTLDILITNLLSDEDCKRSPEFRRMLIRSTSTYLGHNLHIYKAKFFPRMVRVLINAHLPDLNGKKLLDPFVGSGTALYEAQMMGLEAIGFDLDPLSVEISRAKLSLAQIDPEQLFEAINTTLTYINHVKLSKGLTLLPAIQSKKAHIVQLPAMIAEKLSREEVEEINSDASVVKSAIYNTTDNELIRRLLLIALSDALARKIRLRFLGTGHGRFAIEKKKDRIIDLFSTHIQRIGMTAAVIHTIKKKLELQFNASCVADVGDALNLGLPSSCIDLVITSPPYLPASSGRENYVFGKASSLLALDLISENELSILNNQLVGAMSASEKPNVSELPKEAQRFINWLQSDKVRSIKAGPTARYYKDIKQALAEIGRVLKPGATAAVVVARSNTFYRYKTREVLYTVSNASIVGDIGRDVGLELKDIIHVKLHKLNAVARPRSRDDYYESILLFERSK